MSDYRLERTAIGWVVHVGDDPLLVLNEEGVALQVVRDAEALLRNHEAGTSALQALARSPSVQATADADSNSESDTMAPRSLQD